MKYTPIKCEFLGDVFDSKLEARWAVFFHFASLKYTREPQGFDLDGLWYLPDLYIHDWQIFVEVKGGWVREEENKEEWHRTVEKMRRLSSLLQKPLLMVEDWFSDDNTFLFSLFLPDEILNPHLPVPFVCVGWGKFGFNKTTNQWALLGQHLEVDHKVNGRCSIADYLSEIAELDNEDDPLRDWLSRNFTTSSDNKVFVPLSNLGGLSIKDIQTDVVIPLFMPTQTNLIRTWDQMNNPTGYIFPRLAWEAAKQYKFKAPKKTD